MSTYFDTPAKSREVAGFHDLGGRVGAGVIIVCSKTRRVLLGKRGPDCAYANRWAPFGGMVEDFDGSPLVGALRELAEEAGIRIDIDDPNLVKDPVYIDSSKDMNFKFITYAYISSVEMTVTINQESSGFAWFPVNGLPSVSQCHPGFVSMWRSPDFAAVREMLSGK